MQLYFRHALLMITRTYIILISIDRFCMSSPSATIRHFSKKRIAMRLTIIVPFVWFFIPLYIPFLTTLEQQRCIMAGVYGFIYSVYFVIVAGILTPLIMITFTWYAYYNLKKNAKSYSTNYYCNDTTAISKMRSTTVSYANLSSDSVYSFDLVVSSNHGIFIIYQTIRFIHTC